MKTTTNEFAKVGTMHGWTTRDAWTQARLEHFTAGRVLVNAGRFQTGFILLAYAVEFSYKQLISAQFSYNLNEIHENNDRTKVLKSHDLINLHEYTLECDYLISFGNVEKLLSFMNVLSTRYPSGILSNRNKGAYAKGVGVDDIPYVDSLMLELDYQIFKADGESSTYAEALRWLQHGRFGEFFAGNIHIDRHLHEYIEVLKPSERKFLKDHFTSKTLFELTNTDFGRLQVAAHISDSSSVARLNADQFHRNF